ncbi:hypothetical protein BC2926_32780 [Bacillus cereus]|nr:hypothetical protein BC2926_32780 [Bacillus cereus]
MNSNLKIDDLLKYRVEKVVFRKVLDKKSDNKKEKKDSSQLVRKIVYRSS